MYMRMTWFKLRPNCWDHYEARYKELMRPDEGLCGRFLSRDSKDPDAVYIVSLWEDLESLRRWEVSDHFQKNFMPKVQPLIVGQLTVSICEVRHTELHMAASGQKV